MWRASVDLSRTNKLFNLPILGHTSNFEVSLDILWLPCDSSDFSDENWNWLFCNGVIDDSYIIPNNLGIYSMGIWVKRALNNNKKVPLFFWSGEIALARVILLIRKNLKHQLKAPDTDRIWKLAKALHRIRIPIFPMAPNPIERYSACMRLILL